MRQLRPPKTISGYKYVLIEGESSGYYFKLILPNGNSFNMDIDEIERYLMREFDDEEFIGHLLAGATNFRRVQLLPKYKHYYHVPEGLNVK